MLHRKRKIVKVCVRYKHGTIRLFALFCSLSLSSECHFVLALKSLVIAIIKSTPNSRNSVQIFLDLESNYTEVWTLRHIRMLCQRKRPQTIDFDYSTCVESISLLFDKMTWTKSTHTHTSRFSLQKKFANWIPRKGTENKFCWQIVNKCVRCYSMSTFCFVYFFFK